MPVSHAQPCAPSNAAAHASWKCPARALAAASSAARGGSRSRPSAAASSPGASVLYGHPNASPCARSTPGPEGSAVVGSPARPAARPPPGCLLQHSEHIALGAVHVHRRHRGMRAPAWLPSCMRPPARGACQCDSLEGRVSGLRTSRQRARPWAEGNPTEDAAGLRRVRAQRPMVLGCVHLPKTAAAGESRCRPAGCETALVQVVAVHGSTARAKGGGGANGRARAGRAPWARAWR